jgi:flagellar biosynthesis/type III secretory pathway chaperone
MDFETEISGLLDDLTGVQTELLEVLAQKRVALTKPDMQALASLQPREAELATRLSACQERRTALLAEAKREGRPSESVARLASSTNAGKTSKLGAQVKETAARLRILQHHSLANWVLAQRSLLHVSQLLEIIATGGQMRPTYGDRESVHARGSLVNQQA